MERYAKLILDRLLKPLTLALRASFGWGKDLSDGMSGKSGDHPYRPEPGTHSVLTSNPLIPAFLFVLGIWGFLSSAPVHQWLVTGNLPEVDAFFIRIGERQPDAAKVNESVGVWAKKKFGFYYCQGGALFGSQPGELMKQGDALTSGYRPADGQYCTARPRVASLGSVPFRVRQWFASAANNLPTADEVFARFRKTQPALPKESEGATVWAKKQVGFYYCQGDILFGSKPGQVMKQAKALMSGYRPAHRQYCTNSKRDEASTGSLTLPGPSSIK